MSEEKPKYLSPYWVDFETGGAACIEDVDEESAKKQAETLRGPVKQIRQLPYPANPRISAKKSDCPSFCHDPRNCAGRGSCPKNYACSE